jgi:putative addiction module killer protein
MRAGCPGQPALLFPLRRLPGAAKVTTALIRLGRGNTSNVESVGGGVFENKIGFSPGYRVYFGMAGAERT